MRATQRWAWHVSCSGSDASTQQCSSTSWFEVSQTSPSVDQSSEAQGSEIRDRAEIVPWTELSPEAERLYFAQAASATLRFSTGSTPRQRAGARRRTLRCSRYA